MFGTRHTAAFVVRIYEGAGLFRDDDDDAMATADQLERLAAEIRKNPGLVAGPITMGESTVGDFSYVMIKDAIT